MVYTSPSHQVYAPPSLSRLNPGFKSWFIPGSESPGFYTFNQEVEEERLCEEEILPFNPENKPCPARKPPRKGQQTRYRESSRTREARMS